MIEPKISATERRNELLAASRDLILLLQQIAIPVNTIIARLNTESDKLLKKAVEESLDPAFVRKLKRVQKALTQSLPTEDNQTDQEPAEVTERPKGRRQCKKCGAYGHIAKTCRA